MVPHFQIKKLLGIVSMKCTTIYQVYLSFFFKKKVYLSFTVFAFFVLCNV